MLLACLAGALLTCALAPLLTRAFGRNVGWLLAVPLLGAAALVALGYDDAAHSPAEPPAVVESLPWIPSLDVGLDLRLDGLSLVFRILRGPTEAGRAVAGDLLLFGFVGLIALFGVRVANEYTFDIVLVAALVGFLSALSLARALTRGKR